MRPNFDKFVHSVNLFCKNRIQETALMTQKYYQAEEKHELQILGALTDCTATDEQIQEVVNDITLHLSTVGGTLQNYNGKFKKAGLKALQDNYQLFTNDVFNAITQKILDGEKVCVSPALVKMIIDYMHGQTSRSDIVENVKYVSIPFVLGTTGEKSLPKSKESQNMPIEN